VLTDVGKVKIADALLKKPGQLSESEQLQLRAHVQFSLDILATSSEKDHRIFEIVELHHERHDGSGYPHGHAGTAIPLLPRIAGMVDSYDAMISARPYAAARSSFHAMQELSDLRDDKFQGELVEQFMQAVGLFPTGSLVELNTGEVGIVIAQNPSRRLKPKVMVVLNAHKQRCERFDILDLLTMDNPDGRSATVWISKELSPGAFGVDADEFYL
jgi:HD-GYP domain-containing protein (c-di-GMP phosphodiesterase class II)